MNTFRFLSSLNRTSCLRINCFKYYRPACPKNLPFNNQTRIIHVSRHLQAEELKKEHSQIFVYEGPIRRRIKSVKIISLTCTMLGLTMFPKIVYDVAQTNLLFGYFAVVGSLFYFSTPLILHYITKSYVIELYFNAENDTFTAKTYNIVAMLQDFQFKASDVTVPTLPGPFTTMRAKNKGLFVDYRAVKDPDAYAHMMGHDKPFDFEVYEEKPEDKS
ncbi:transmembrane protein 70, mitochondrial-like [Uloborus diversus]|uniref:transmembrane protein 70, mitochondrial-like n=1 Tax=Uloborus diversus TaxID=327109 RepID=UPI0024098B73|nr:transmembrane protein 70, mitochondrial-like [Uloborus diversus]